MGRGGRAGTKRNRKRNGLTTEMDSENSDEDYIIEEDEMNDQLDELDISVRKGRAGTTKAKSKRNGRAKATDSASSDEDYLVEEDETDDLSDELYSLVGDDSEEEKDFRFEEEECLDEEEEILEKVVRSKAQNGSLGSRKNGTNGSKKRRRFICDEEEDDEDYDTKVKEETLVDEDAKSSTHKKDCGTRGVDTEGIRKSRSSRQDAEEDDEDYEDCEDYDEDDDEFTPDEIDSLDEEEETPRPRKEIKKRGRLREKKAVSTKRQRCEGNMKVVKKSARTKKKKRGTVRRKCKLGNDEDFIERVPPPRGRSKRKPARRKQKIKVDSDSDFISDGASDYEFTISEEEREQVKEANRICGDLGPNLRTSKKIQDDVALPRPRKSPCRKGKEKAEDVKSATKQVCGICLTEEGKSTVRGTLDCCSHFFCFACIIEWSKVETRCPLCKQRFMTISKPARCGAGIDLRNSLIHVPERNQVYQPSEDEVRDYLDPYENVLCTECHQGGDDALMLLCDLCDSPAHTYCVGLGRQVPAGNWYCEVCRPSVLASANTQAQDVTPVRVINTNIANEPSMFENLAEIDLNVTIPETPLSQENGFSPSPRYPGGNQTFSPVSGVGVSTLFGRRRIHRQIHNILSTNRMSQTATEFGGVSTSDPRGNILSSELNRVDESTTQQNRPSVVGNSLIASYMGTLGYGPSLPRPGNDLFPGMINDTRDRVVFPNGVYWGRFRGTNPGLNRPAGNEQLQPCSSRTSVAASTSTPSYVREGQDSSFTMQLQLMIRKHLRSLSGDMELGYSTFEDIEETSKHTILAACGLECRSDLVCRMQPPACPHSGHVALIRGCCSSCFDSFVGLVVRTAMDVKVPNWIYYRN